MRFVVSLAQLTRLLKAQQLSLFGRPKMATPHQGMHQEQHVVRAHVRQGEHGPVVVAPHVRTVHVAPHPEPSQELPETPQEYTQRTGLPYHLPEPPQAEVPASIVPPPAESGVRQGDPGGEATVAADARPPSVGSVVPTGQPEKLPNYGYRSSIGAKPLWLPEGATEADGVYTLAQPLHMNDAALLHLIPVDETGQDRRWDPYETGEYTVQVPDKHGELYDEVHYTSGAAPRELFAPLAARWDEFEAKVQGLEKRARRLGLEPPKMTLIGSTTRRVPVEMIGWGQEARTVYGNLPATLVRIENPKLQVKGWTVGAVIKPMPGTKYTQVTAIGEAGKELPPRFHTTGMHCDHCNTDRDRTFVVGLRNDHTGQWQQVGGSCLSDFTGRSASNLASSAEWLKDWWKQDGEDIDSGGTRRAERVHDLDDVLMAAAYIVDEDGGYVSRAKAEETGIKATSDSVSDLLGNASKAAQVRANPGLRERAAAVRAWLGTLPDPAFAKVSDYQANLYAIGQATGVPRRSLGVAVSAVAAYARAQQDALYESLPKTHFGKPGDKIGRKLSKKEKAEGLTEYPPVRVRVVAAFPIETPYGVSTIVTARDAHGHVFKWKASGSPTHANADAMGTPWNLRDVAPGEQFDLVATVKKHSEYKGTPQTDVTRAELHRVYSPSEREDFREQADQYKRAALDKADALPAMVREYDAASEQIKADLQAEGTYAGERQAWNRWRAEKLATDPTAFGRAGYHDPDYPPSEYQAADALRAVADPEALDAAAAAHAHERVKHHARLAVRDPVEVETPLKKGGPMRLLIKAAPGGMGMPRRPAAPKPAPPTDPAMSPGAHGPVPATPGQKVKFTHPATGEEQPGHIHASGPVGATIVDGEGTVHRVPHGQYMHDTGGPPGAESGPKPQAKLVGIAARKHLELGVDQPLCVYGAAALLVIGGVKVAHALKSEDVQIEDGVAKVVPDKLQTDDEALVPVLEQLQKQSPRGPLFQIRGQPITADALTTYVRRFGVQHAGGAPGVQSSAMAKAVTAGDVAAVVPEDMEGAKPKKRKRRRKGWRPPVPPVLEAQDLQKAAAGALDLPERVGTAVHRWPVGQYTCEFRQAPNGVSYVSIWKPGMPLELHEIVGDMAKARRLADDLVSDLTAGKAPRRGLFQRVAG